MHLWKLSQGGLSINNHLKLYLETNFSILTLCCRPSGLPFVALSSQNFNPGEKATVYLKIWLNKILSLSKKDYNFLTSKTPSILQTLWKASEDPLTQHVQVGACVGHAGPWILSWALPLTQRKSEFCGKHFGSAPTKSPLTEGLCEWGTTWARCCKGYRKQN